MTITTDAAAALREAADLLEAHPDLPRPYITTTSDGRAHVSYQLMNSAPKEQKAAAQRVLRAIGGEWDKSAFLDDFYMRRSHGRLDLTIMAHRDQVCVRRVVGTEQVTVPAVDAQPERVETRDVVEWDCAPILGDLDAPIPHALATPPRMPEGMADRGARS